MKNPKVAVIKTNTRRVINDIGKVMDQAGYKNALPKKYETLIKLNLSWSLYYPACSTEPWQLKGVLKKLQEDGYEKITPVENKTVVTNPWKGAKQNKWLPILEEHGLEFQPLTDVKWVKYKPKNELLALNEVFEQEHKIPAIFKGKNVLHLPTMKCHGHTTITGSMKNAFGGLITEKRHHCHKKIHEVLVDLLTIQQEIHKGIFTVTDGTVCGNGAGPRTMEPVIKDYVLASEDSVAIDAISAKMMGFNPLKIPFIKLAHDKGLGVGDPEQIDVIGEDISKVDFGFKTGKSPVVFMDQVLRTKYPILEPILFHTPLFKMCILGSAVYHDYLWYPLIGKRKVKEFMKTKWGKLWKQY